MIYNSLTVILFQTLFFFLPAYIGNTSPVIFSKLKPFSNWNFPADFYKKYKGKRILGDHKTIRGYIVGIIFSATMGLLQFYLVKNNIWKYHHAIYLDPTKSLILSLLLGFGALFGDSLKSFFKRQVGIDPGKPWVPFDWIDFTIGAIILSFWYYYPGTIIYIVGIFLNPMISLLSNLLSRLIGLKKTWI